MADDTQQIALSNPTPETDQISLGTNPYAIPSDTSISTRSAKASYGLGDITQQPYDSILEQFAKGDEQGFRYGAAAKIDVIKDQARNKYIADVAAKAPDAAQLASDKFFMAKLQGIDPPTDPNTVLEEYYSRRILAPMVNPYDDFTKRSFMNRAMQDEPDMVNGLYSTAQDLKSKYEIAATRTQQAEDKLAQQSYLGRGINMIENLFPLYQEARLRGLTDTDFFRGMLGENLDKQRAALWSDPDYANKLDQIMTHLEQTDPSLAVYFGHAVMGQSKEEIQNSNLNTAYALTDIGTAVGAVAKAGIKAGLAARARSVWNKPVADALKTAVQTQTEDPWAMTSLGQSMYNAYFPKSALWMWEEPPIKTIPTQAAISRGDLATAAVAQTAANMTEDQNGKLNPAGRAVESLSDNLRIKGDMIKASESKVGGQELANRIADRTANVADVLQEAATKSMMVNRVPSLTANQDLAKAAMSAQAGRYAGPNSTVLGTSDLRWMGEKNGINYHEFDVHLGDHDGELYPNREQAEGYLKLHPNMTGWTIEPQGNGFYLSKAVPLDETGNSVRDNLIDFETGYAGKATKGKRQGTVTPYLWTDDKGNLIPRITDLISNFGTKDLSLTKLRTPEETLSPAENAQRKVATFGPGRLQQMFLDNSKTIEKGLTKDLQRVLTQNQTMLDPLTKKDGYFFRTIGELEDHYLRYVSAEEPLPIGRLPTQKEIEAYFAFTNNYEMERGLQTSALMRNKYRTGVMQHSISMRKPFVKGGLVKSDFFEGRILDDIPSSKDAIFINNGKSGDERIIDSSRIPKKLRAEMKEAIANGEGKLIKIWDPEQESNIQTFQKFSKKYDPNDARLVYVYSKNVDSKMLDYANQVMERGGGHIIYDYPKWLRQAMIFRDKVTGKVIYLGDRTIMPFRNGALGEQVGKHLTEVAKLIGQGNEQGARAYHLANNGGFGMDFDKHVLPKFKDSRDPNGNLVKAQWNVETPFTLLDNNMTTLDKDNKLALKYGDRWVDGTRHGNDAKINQVQFTGKRDAFDLHTIEDKGTKRNPDYQYRPAKAVDPVDSMNRAISRMVNSFHMDDYRYMAAEHWLQTALPHLNIPGVDKLAELRRSPFYYFQKGEFLKNTPASVRNVLEANRKKIQDFISTPSKIDAEIQNITQKLVDGTYSKFGGKWTVIPAQAIPFSKNPLQNIRSLAVHAKLGLFSIPAMFVQGTAMSNIWAISPRASAISTMGGLFHLWSTINPNMVDKLDEFASKLKIPGLHKYSPGEWKEAYNLSKETNFFHVGGEYSILDIMQNHSIQNWADFIKYWGMTPFRWGAQSVRSTAWYAAHKEWRVENPTGPVTRDGKAWILNRASDLDHNMSRASNSALNSGAMAFPAMFYTYARNLTELFWGKRLTVGEKARLFGVNSLLWGIPAGGVGLMGFPVGDWVRQQALKGTVSTPFGSVPIPGGAYTPGKDYWTWLMEGFPSEIGNLITGNLYNFSRFGVKGWDIAGDVLNTDKNIFDLIGGAPYSVVANTWKRSSGFRKAMWDTMTLNPDPYKFTYDDIASLFKEFSGFSYAYRTAYAIATHKLISNNGSLLQGDVSTADALWRGITGTTDVRVSDISNKLDILREREGLISQIRSNYARDWNRALLSLSERNLASYQTFMKNAQKWLIPLRPDEIARVIHEINKPLQPLIDKLEWDLTFRHTPQEEQNIQWERHKKMLDPWNERQNEKQP